MDIEKYISSGILEAYALGDVTPAERAEVEKILSEYPEVRAELARIEETLEDIAFHAAIDPHQGLKKKVLGSILGEEATPSSLQPEEKGKVVPISETGKEDNKRSGTYRYLMAAAITLAVISSFSAFYFFNKWQDAEERLYLVVAERTALAEQVKTVENQLDRVNEELAVFSNESFNQIELQGQEIAPAASATVFWNKATKEVFLNPEDLPATPEDRQYQLWAIVEGQPVDLGLVTADKNDGLIKMKAIENASAFGITLEPAGGSPSPTLDQLYVLGEAS